MNLILLESSGPIQTGTGISLPLPYFKVCYLWRFLLHIIGNARMSVECLKNDTGRGFWCNLYFLDRFSYTNQISNSKKILTVRAELFHVDGRTDRRTDEQTVMTQLIFAFCNFANGPKNVAGTISIPVRSLQPLYRKIILHCSRLLRPEFRTDVFVALFLFHSIG